MIKLFDEIPRDIRDSIVIYIEYTILKAPQYRWAELVFGLSQQYQSEEIKDFIDFYFNMRMEQLKDESSDN